MAEKLNLRWHDARQYLLDHGARGCGSIADVLMRFPDLKWGEEAGADGTGRVIFAIIGGDKSIGEIRVVFAIERGRVRAHKHKPRLDGNPVRETIEVFAGVMGDRADDGSSIDVRMGEVIEHSTDDPHSPSTKEFTLGMYQNNGVTFTE